jgi:hypothetical protein
MHTFLQSNEDWGYCTQQALEVNPMHPLGVTFLALGPTNLQPIIFLWPCLKSPFPFPFPLTSRLWHSICCSTIHFVRWISWTDTSKCQLLYIPIWRASIVVCLWREGWCHFHHVTSWANYLSLYNNIIIIIIIILSLHLSSCMQQDRLKS